MTKSPHSPQIQRDCVHVADVLKDVAWGRALLGGDDRSVRAYVNAARIVNKFGGELPAAFASGELAAVRGIGKSTLAIVGLALADQPVPALQQVREQVPAGLFAAKSIKGLGPNRLRTLWRDLGLTDLAEIEYACTENRLADLKGFGPTVQHSILSALQDARDRAGQMRVDRAWSVALAAIESIKSQPGVREAWAVGPLRRGHEVVPGVQLAVRLDPDSGKDTDAVAAALGNAKTTVHVGTDPRTFGALVALCNAGDAHLLRLQERAASLQIQLSSAGLRRDGGLLDTPDEAAFYSALGVHPTPVERRDSDDALVPLDQPAPELVTFADLRGALHNHTTASDGIHSLEQMRDAAAIRGLRYLGISDHSQAAAYAGGLSVERLVAQRLEIAALNTQGHACTLLSGVESDILRDGALDYDDADLDALDVVVASVHNRFGQDGAAMTERMVRAAAGKRGDIIGHPTGRLLLGRPAADVDIDRLLAACAESHTAVELNANPQRLDLSAEHLQKAVAIGCKVSIAADAHAAAGLDCLALGIAVARRAGVKANAVINCMELGELREWIATRRTA